MTTMETVLTAVVAAPGISFLMLAGCWLFGWTPPERLVARLTRTLFALMTAGVAWLAAMMLAAGVPSVRIDFGNWFHAGDYQFPLAIFVDRLSLPLAALTVVLVGLVGAFSVRYVHRERGFFRFFLLLHVFAFGSLLVFTAGSLDLLIGGWELVGITSALLIAFFDERREPVRNALRVFAAYRIADVGLLLSSFVLHHGGSTLFDRTLPGEWPEQTSRLAGSEALLAGFLLLMAASGKSAQGPFAGWLPRAMEGPTPSSSIFYGAISIHVGAYLLLRFEPLLRATPLVAGCVVATGVMTALLGTLSHRVATDAKTSLAFASMTQLGIIFAEIGLGFPRLALMHILGHATVRTFQLLRAPSMLHDYHRMHAAAGGHLAATGAHLNRLTPEFLRLPLYRFGLERGFYDAAVERLVVRPVMLLARFLDGWGGSGATPAARQRRTGGAIDRGEVQAEPEN